MVQKGVFRQILVRKDCALSGTVYAVVRYPTSLLPASLPPAFLPPASLLPTSLLPATFKKFNCCYASTSLKRQVNRIAAQNI